MSQERINLRAHHDVTNLAKTAELDKVMTETLYMFIDQLKLICGPFSRNALVLQQEHGIPSNQLSTANDNRYFMRDGAHIISATECVSPVQQYLKSLIHYVGTRVDKSCKDGTTTSMIATCSAIIQAIALKKALRSTPLFKIEKATAEVCDELAERMKKHVITVEDVMSSTGCSHKQALGALTFIHVYTATGGDVDVATAVSEYFSTLPAAVWGESIPWRSSTVETNEFRCKPVRLEYELEIDAMNITIQHNNHDYRKFYKSDNADVLVMYQGLNDASIATEDLFQYITSRVDSGNLTPLIIMVPALDNHYSSGCIERLNAISEQYKTQILVVTYSVLNNRFNSPWAALAITGKANVPLYDEKEDIEKCVIKGVEVLISYKYIKFNNLVPKDDRVPDEDLTHPGILYPDDYPHFTDTYNRILRERELVKDAHREVVEEREEVEKAFANLSAKRGMALYLGGRTHDQKALLAVIEDAAGSAQAVATSGVITNAISRVVRECRIARTDPSTKHKSELHLLIWELLERTFAMVEGTLVGTMSVQEHHDEWKTYNELMDSAYSDKFTYVDLVNLMNQGSMELRSSVGAFSGIIDPRKEIREQVLSEWETQGYPPTQAARMTSELLGRISEVAMRAGMVEMFIVPGGAWVSDKE
jgi:hypothetical protein